MWTCRGQDSVTTPHSTWKAVERVSSFQFLSLTVTEDLSWGINTASVVRKSPTTTLLPQEAEESKTCHRSCWLTSTIVPLGHTARLHGAPAARCKAELVAMQRVVKTLKTATGDQHPQYHLHLPLPATLTLDSQGLGTPCQSPISAIKLREKVQIQPEWWSVFSCKPCQIFKFQYAYWYGNKTVNCNVFNYVFIIIYLVALDDNDYCYYCHYS